MLYNVTLSTTNPLTNVTKVSVHPISARTPLEAAQSAKLFIQSTYWNTMKVDPKVEVLDVDYYKRS